MRCPAISLSWMAASMAAPVAAQVVHTESDVIGPAGQFQDFFGEDLATSGGLLLAGVRNADNPAGVSSGGAFLYANDGKRWHEVQRLWPPDGGQADQFGNAVALSGSTAAVGSWFDDDLGHDSGSVYVYERTSSGWTEIGVLAGMVNRAEPSPSTGTVPRIRFTSQPASAPTLWCPPRPRWAKWYENSRSRLTVPRGTPSKPGPK